MIFSGKFSDLNEVKIINVISISKQNITRVGIAMLTTDTKLLEDEKLLCITNPL